MNEELAVDSGTWVYHLFEPEYADYIGNFRTKAAMERYLEGREPLSNPVSGQP